MRHLRSCAFLLAALLMAGCAATGGQGLVTGHLAGRLVMEGGPIGPGGKQPGERPIPGTVTFTAAGHRQVAVQVGTSGTFSVRLPPGTYQVSGRSSSTETSSGSGASEREQELPCSQPLSAKITAGQTASITVTCVVP